MTFKGDGDMPQAGCSARSQESHVESLRKEGFKFLSWGGDAGKRGHSGSKLSFRKDVAVS